MIQKYTQGQIVTTLNSLLPLIPAVKLDADKHTAAKTNDDDDDTVVTADMSTTSTLTKSTFSPASRRYGISSNSTCSTSKGKYTPRGIFPKKAPVHSIIVDIQVRLASLDLPGEMSDLDHLLSGRYCKEPNCGSKRSHVLQCKCTSGVGSRRWRYRVGVCVGIHGDNKRCGTDIFEVEWAV